MSKLLLGLLPLFLIIVFSLARPVDSQHSMNMAEYLPDEIDGWKKSGQDIVHDPATLYQYINGGAELFISYDFKSMRGRKLARPENPDDIINVDLFDMGNPANAFGVFSQGCETCDTSIGQGSQYSGGLLTFWKGQYYVSILAYPESEAKRDAVLKIGRHIAAAIQAEGALPAILSLLPDEGLVKESIRYFHHYIWLNSHYFISNENILQIDKQTEAALAKYQHGDARYFLLLLLYPGKKQAQTAYESFQAHYLKGHSGAMKLEDGRWTGCRLKERLVMIVFNADTKERISGLFDQVSRRVKILYTSNSGG